MENKISLNAGTCVVLLDIILFSIGYNSVVVWLIEQQDIPKYQLLDGNSKQDIPNVPNISPLVQKYKTYLTIILKDYPSFMAAIWVSLNKSELPD